MKNNNTNTDFLESTKWMDVVLSIVEWACYTFLACTTGIMVYGVASSMAESSSELVAYRDWFVTFAIVIMFFVIDFGLKDKFRAYLRMRHQKSAIKSPRHARLFMNFLLVLIVARGIATMTSSVWAAPEIAEYTAGTNKAEEFARDIMKLDSNKMVREERDRMILQELQGNENKRIERAKMEADRIVDIAISSGDRWQRASYNKEGFAWLENRKNPEKKDHAYARRIRKAKKEADDFIEKERNAVAQANIKYQSTAADTSYQRNTATLAQLSIAANNAWQQKISRRNNYVILLDIIALCVGFFITWIRELRKIAAGESMANRSFVGIIGKAITKAKDGMLDFLEDLVGLDINGDGRIGTQPQTPQAVPASITIQSGATGATIPDPDNGNNFFFRGGNKGGNNPSPAGATGAQQPGVTTGRNSGETVVKQSFQGQQEKGKQPPATGQGETDIVIVNHDEKYLRQRCRQNYYRMYEQTDPTTPRKNFDKLSKQLEALGYNIHQEEKQGQRNIWMERDGVVYGKSIL